MKIKKFNLNNEDIKKKIIDNIALQYNNCNAIYDPMIGVYNSKNNIIYYTNDDIDALVDVEMHKIDATPVSILDHNINKINNLVKDWNIMWVDDTAYGITDDPDYLPGYYYIDVDGMRGHRFYNYIEYSQLRQFGCTYKFNEHSIKILSLILSDIDTGLWSIDMRFSSVLTLLNYMKPILSIDLIEEIHKNRKHCDDIYKISDTNNLFEEA